MICYFNIRGLNNIAKYCKSFKYVMIYKSNMHVFPGQSHSKLKFKIKKRDKSLIDNQILVICLKCILELQCPKESTVMCDKT